MHPRRARPARRRSTPFAFPLTVWTRRWLLMHRRSRGGPASGSTLRSWPRRNWPVRSAGLLRISDPKLCSGG
jgi:hypothetical protein